MLSRISTIERIDRRIEAIDRAINARVKNINKELNQSKKTARPKQKVTTTTNKPTKSMDCTPKSMPTLGDVPDHSHDEVHAHQAMGALSPLEFSTIPSSFQRDPVPYGVSACEATSSVVIPTGYSMFVLYAPTFSRTSSVSCDSTAKPNVAQYALVQHGTAIATSLELSDVISPLNLGQMAPTAATITGMYNLLPMGADIEISIMRADHTKAVPIACESTPSKQGLMGGVSTNIRDDDYVTTHWGAWYNTYQNTGNRELYPCTTSGSWAATNCGLPYEPRTAIHLSMGMPSFRGTNEYLPLTRSSDVTSDGFSDLSFSKRFLPWSEVSNTTGASITVRISGKVRFAYPLQNNFARMNPQSTLQETPHPAYNKSYTLARCGGSLGPGYTVDVTQARVNSLGSAASNLVGATAPVVNVVQSLLTAAHTDPVSIAKHATHAVADLCKSHYGPDTILAKTVAKQPVPPHIVAKAKKGWFDRFRSAVGGVAKGVLSVAEHGIKFIEENPQVLAAVAL